MPNNAAGWLKKVSPEPVKDLSRPVFRVAGRLTVSRRRFPDFLIIGTKRGGTTSTFRYLQRHPGVLPMFPAVENAKKTHYFDQNFHRGEAWYRAHFPSDRQRRRVTASEGYPAVTGEAAPYYMFHPLVLERVRATMPEVKIIVLLRNPVDRIWSHYNERVKMGTEPLDFKAALEAEAGRLAGEAERIVSEPGYYSERHDFCSYLARGRYLEHLEPWLEAFPPDQLLVVRSEDIYLRPETTLPAVHRFLGIREVPPPSPHRINYVPTSKIDPETRAWLADYYRPHVSDLERRLDRSFSWNLELGGVQDAAAAPPS